MDWVVSDLKSAVSLLVPADEDERTRHERMPKMFVHRHFIVIFILFSGWLSLPTTTGRSGSIRLMTTGCGLSTSALVTNKGW